MRERKKELEGVKNLLKKRKAELAALEDIAATKSAVKRYSPASLGQNSNNGGGVAGRKTRFEVLDRVSKAGAGLSDAQKNDWPWFKEMWDKAMLEEHGQDWGGTFASWIQNVINDCSGGANNAFSVFVHAETRRVLAETTALMVP